jgi:DNA-binding transcriptional LysR family regulator
MHFDDLKKIIHLAHSQNIQISAKALCITAGALSKTLKKIENHLQTDLFDRVGRNIQINAQGKKFINYALNITHEYEQMCSEFTDKRRSYLLKVSGPAVLLDDCLKKIIPLISRDNTELSVDALYEGDALKRLVNGQSHIAIVTNEVLDDVSALALSSVSLGATKYEVVAGHKHKIFTDFPDGHVALKDLVNYSFICPKTSPFCGIERGVGSDGWLDHKYPRKILSRSDDLNVLLSIVNQNIMLAYIPDIVINKEKLRIINVTDYSHEYTEEYSVVYKQSTADGWLNQLIDKL